MAIVATVGRPSHHSSEAVAIAIAGSYAPPGPSRPKLELEAEPEPKAVAVATLMVKVGLVQQKFRRKIKVAPLRKVGRLRRASD